MTENEESSFEVSRRMVLGGTSAAAAGLTLGAIGFAGEAQAASYVRPVKDWRTHPITAHWRQRGSWSAGYHTGVDIGCPIGTPVYATIHGDVRTGRASWALRTAG